MAGPGHHLDGPDERTNFAPEVGNNYGRNRPSAEYERPRWMELQPAGGLPQWPPRLHGHCDMLFNPPAEGAKDQRRTPRAIASAAGRALVVGVAGDVQAPAEVRQLRVVGPAFPRRPYDEQRAPKSCGMAAG
jgi:hypothetical protein